MSIMKIRTLKLIGFIVLKNKNKLMFFHKIFVKNTFLEQSPKKLRTASLRSDFTGSYKKKRVILFLICTQYHEKLSFLFFIQCALTSLKYINGSSRNNRLL